MIEYDHSTHTYSYRGRRYLSATQLIGFFSEDFQNEQQAALFAYRHGQTKEHWLQQWAAKRDQALDRGNRIHNLREDIVRNRSMDVAFGKPFPVQNIERYPDDYPLSRLPDGIYPEMKLWRHDCGIAGRADKVILETIPGHFTYEERAGKGIWVPAVRVAHIQDYKSNRFIRMRSFNHPVTGYRMMKPPFDDLMDCDIIHYEIQTSIYQYMLEYHGFAPGRREVIHFPHVPPEAPPGATEPPPVTYPCTYRRDHVTSMIRYLVSRRIL